MHADSSSPFLSPTCFSEAGRSDLACHEGQPRWRHGAAGHETKVTTSPPRHRRHPHPVGRGPEMARTNHDGAATISTRSTTAAEAGVVFFSCAQEFARTAVPQPLLLHRCRLPASDSEDGIYDLARPVKIQGFGDMRSTNKILTQSEKGSSRTKLVKVDDVCCASSMDFFSLSFSPTTQRSAVHDHLGRFVTAQAQWYVNLLDAGMGEALACSGISMTVGSSVFSWKLIASSLCSCGTRRNCSGPFLIRFIRD